MNRAPTSLTAGICFQPCRLLVRNAGYYLSATYRHFEMPREHGQTPVSTYYPGLRLG